MHFCTHGDSTKLENIRNQGAVEGYKKHTKKITIQFKKKKRTSELDDDFSHVKWGLVSLKNINISKSYKRTCIC